jgi:hypothetical protein
MSRFRALTPLTPLMLVALTLLVPSFMGCAADTATAGQEAESSDEIRSTLLGNVGAIRINGGAPVAAPSKVQRILENIGLAAGSPRPQEGGYRCPPSYVLDVLDAKGNVKATIGLLCGAPGASPRQGVQGSVQVGGRSFLITAQDVDAIDAIGQEPLAVGDVIYGADRVQIAAPARAAAAPKETNDLGRILKLGRAMNNDLPPDPYARMARCMPTRALGFFKGPAQLATVSFACAEDERGVVSGSFSGRDAQVSGGISVDASVVLDIESQL